MTLNSKTKDNGKFDIVILDLLNWAHKYQWALRTLSTKRGRKSGVVYGIARKVFELEEKFRPKKIYISLDGYINKRKELSSDYKSDRSKKNKDFWNQIDDVKILLKSHMKKILMVSSTGYEADDIAAYLVKKNKKKSILLYSEDADWLLLLDRGEKVSQFKDKRIWNKKMALEFFKNKYGVSSFNEMIAFNILYGVKHNHVKGAFRKPQVDKILKSLSKKDMKDPSISVLAIKAIDLGIKVTEKAIGRMTINKKITSFFDSGYSLTEVRGQESFGDFIRICKKYEMKSIIDKMKECLIK